MCVGHFHDYGCGLDDFTIIGRGYVRACVCWTVSRLLQGGDIFECVCVGLFHDYYRARIYPSVCVLDVFTIIGRGCIRVCVGDCFTIIPFICLSIVFIRRPDRSEEQLLLQNMSVVCRGEQWRGVILQETTTMCTVSFRARFIQPCCATVCFCFPSSTERNGLNTCT